MADQTIDTQITRIEQAKADIQAAVASYGLTSVTNVSLSNIAPYVYEIGSLYVPIEGDIEVGGKKTFTGKLQVNQAPEEENDAVRKLELDRKQEIVPEGYNIMYGITFVGTLSQYNAANQAGVIPIGSVVVITDSTTPDIPDTPSTDATTAKLGTAKLGSMILGQA